ncbi:lantibiotic dehydratase [Thermogemmatispora sp.]|uniref:lantibiotic dehydratase n=1 Tax=Thermogemmatispora sp. TaxID=1968838 RepID=UPI0035E45AEE
MKEQHNCSVAEEYVIRIAGLPLTALAALRFQRSLALIEELWQVEEVLSSSGNRLSERLHTAIGRLTGDEERRRRQQLIELRRAIFQGRPPAAAHLAPALLAALPADLREEILRWHELLQRRSVLLAEARRLFEAELGERREALRELVGRERFLQGVLLASPSLYLDCCRWLAAPPAEAGRYLDRKLEDGLLNYLARMAAKTSPYSTFTALARGRFLQVSERERGTELLAPETDELERGQSVIEANILLVHHLAQALARRSDIRPSLPVNLNPSLAREAGGVRFVSRDELGQERLVALRATPALQIVLQLVEGRQPLTYGTLLETLVALDPQERRQELAAFLDQLIACGLLQLTFAIPEQAHDYLRRLCEALASIGQAPVQALRAQLIELDEALIAYERATEARRRYAILQHLRALLERLFEELGLSGRPGYSLPAKNLIYEHILIKQVPGGNLPALESDLLADLALVRRLIALCEPLLAGRLALATFFGRRYGEGASVDLLTFYEECYRQGQSLMPGLFEKAEGTPSTSSALPSPIRGMQLFGALLGSRPTEHEELARLQVLRQELAGALAEQPPDKAGVRHLERQWLAARLEALEAQSPAWGEPPRSLALHCQLYWQDGQRYLVLNSIQSGFGRSLRRLGYLEAALASRSQEPAEMNSGGLLPSAEEDPLPIAIQGVFGSNLNLRLPGGELEIAYPGSFGSGSHGQSLPLSDLLVQHDPASQRLLLISRRLGRKLLPIHLGLMSDYWLPPLYRFLLWAFGEMPTEHLWSLRLLLLDQPLKGESRGTEEPQPRYRPRTCLGRICLERAHWHLPPACLPLRHRGEAPFDYFLRVQRWRTRYGLPARCFLRVNPFDFQAVQGQGLDVPAYSLSKERKPVYMDFESYFALGTFERLIEKGRFGLLLEEALPAEADLLPTREGKYVCEYIFEVNSRGATDHGAAWR